MNIEQFDKTRWGANMFVTHEGKKKYVIAVDFTERLLALTPARADYPADEWNWVRCENIELSAA